MPIGDPYATVAQLKARLRINDTKDDTRLAEAITAASQGIETVCERQFNDAGAASARTYRPEHRHLVRVDDFHTTTGLVIKTAQADGTFTGTWSPGEYELEPLDGIVGGVPGWPWWTIRAITQRFPCNRRATVQVTARWGWAAIPTAVKESCLIVAEEIFKLPDNPFGSGGYSDFGVIKVRNNPFAMRMLSPYLRYPVLMS
ncbi:hypothetical protein SD37_11745 [Amycolatopsis orientalis]|uniref:Phage gp6-like head-tail connector protein n=1 Tax=Amycolatopsis orientalis TaxID=31958 RepID=A0A193BVJ4_AMYOR|nr:phage head-tail connector protein [Amycolatopsis orientalis]ANN16251.1 hypothetical protein SD37_11745 [Amycolatopsis orientalis]